MKQYDSSEIEKKWQKYWAENQTYKTENSVKGKENFYALSEFAYPSGNLHVGHWYAFAVPDIYARFKRMNGYNVLYPMGFDSFGLPAENAAIKRELDPKKWTYENMDYMKKQLTSMGASFDWDRTITTCDPEYYKWTQWMFTEFYKNDLVERSLTKTNWCESCKTVLANEQVTNGQCERCDSDVVQKDMAQWMLKITKFADELHDDLDMLEWDNSIKQAQREWIGRKEGSEISFKIKDSKNEIDVFTTRVDTLFGVTYVVLAPEHKLVQKLKLQIENWDEVEKYLKETEKKSDLERQQLKEKTGVSLKGVFVINPATNEETPVLVADYVLAHFGTGAVMAVPAHDERDAEFAIKFNLPFRFVVLPSAGEIGNSRQLLTSGENAFILSAGSTESDGQDIINAEWNAMYDLLGTCETGILPKGKRFCCTFEGKLINSPGKKNDEPTFIDSTEDSAPKDNKPFIERDAIVAIVRNPKDNTYLGLKWKEIDWETWITGGTEKGQTSEEAARAEVLEETGYKNLRLVRELPKYHAKFWHNPKKQNRFAHFSCFLFELENEEQEKISKKERERHEYVWLTEKELMLFNLTEGQQWAFDQIEQSNIKSVGIFNGQTSEEVRKNITEAVDGILKKTYRLRDWGISRQRYWGTPIPIVYDPEGNPHVVPKEYLPWILPGDVDYTPDGTAPLARSAELKRRTEEIFGKGWTPEVDTMDTFVDSSWYFYRYLDNKNSEEFASKDILKKWMPVDMYFGGAEHTTMHLLYSRFWVKALHKLGLVFKNEPYKRRLNRGLILGPDGAKMSKSKGNVIDPDEVVAHVGADAVRMYLAFIGPFNEPGNYPWDPNGVVGVRRFIERVYRLSEKVSNEKSSETLEKLVHKTIKKVTNDVERLKLNTAISSMMIFVNETEKLNFINKKDYELLLKMFGTFAPHVAEEIWQEILGNKESIHIADWPIFDKNLVIDEEITLGVQINGKVRAEVIISIDADENEVKEISTNNSDVQKWLGEKEIKKFIYVPGRIINIVI